MREEEKKEEKKQKGNSKTAQRKARSFFIAAPWEKCRARGRRGLQIPSSRGVTRHLVHLENFSAIISSDVSGIH